MQRIMKQVKQLSPLTYQKHPIHGESRTWAETNCYVDVLVELLHGLGYDPVAALAFTIGIDYEGDQWTFFKYPHEDLYALYGIEIQELNPWHSLVEHVDKQLALKRPVLVEMDSFFLPDTAGTAYKSQHVKSTIAINAMDIDKKYLGYFHGSSYYELEGDDFINIFQLDGLAHERMLPPYIEYVKTRQLNEPLSKQQQLKISLGLLKRHLQLAPRQNPFTVFKKAFEKDLPWLLEAGIETFHIYSFATLRQYGACFELVSSYLNWLAVQDQTELEPAIESFTHIANTAKALQFQLARTVTRKKPLSLSSIDDMATSWDKGMTTLKQKYL